MAELTIERTSGTGDGTLELTIGGPLTIAEAARFQEALVEALGAAREVSLHLRGVTAMDLAALQLLCAAHGSAESAGKTLRVEAEGNGVYRKVVDDAGFQTHVGCQRDADSCVWTGGKC